MGSPMYQHIIGDKRASLSPAQRSRNGFCSTAGRRETQTHHEPSSIVRPSARKGSDFNADTMSVGIDVGLGGPYPQVLDAAEGGDPFEDRVRQRFLEIVPPSRCEFFDFGPEEIIVPSADRIVILRNGYVVEPYLDGDQEPLRGANFKIMESDVRLNC
jgi:hypothetical protein